MKEESSRVKKWRMANPKKYRSTHARNQKTYSSKIKQRVFEYYGLVCKRCGESDLNKLSIDHIAENGHEHRKELNNRGGHAFYRWLIRNGFPEGYQTLCLRCNREKSIEFRRRAYPAKRAYLTPTGGVAIGLGL